MHVEESLSQSAFTKAVEALRRGDARTSLSQCDLVLATAPGHIDALHIRGLALHSLGDHQAAAVAIEQAVGRAPRNAVLHGNLGRVWAAAGNMQKAASSFAAAVSLAPNNGTYHADLGNALVRLGRIDDGCAAFERALALTPSSDPVRDGLFKARMLQAEGWAREQQHQRAAHAYAQALQLRSADP